MRATPKCATCGARLGEWTAAVQDGCAAATIKTQYCITAVVTAFSSPFREVLSAEPMSQQNPPPNSSRRKVELPRLKRKFSRALISALNDMDNRSGSPREVRLTRTNGHEIKPTVLYDYDAIGDEQE